MAHQLNCYLGMQVLFKNKKPTVGKPRCLSSEFKLTIVVPSHIFVLGNVLLQQLKSK